MIIEPHPDTLTNNHAVKQITRGSRQFADDMAMDAMWQALNSGMGKEEAGKVFNDTYKKYLDDTPVICTLQDVKDMLDAEASDYNEATNKDDEPSWNITLVFLTDEEFENLPES